MSDLENQAFEELDFQAEINRLEQSSKAFQNVSDDNDKGEILYIKKKYSFLEKLYRQYVIYLLTTINSLFWEGLQCDDITLLSTFIKYGEKVMPGKNPNNINDLLYLFFTNKRSRLQLQECVKIAINCNVSYLTEIRKFAEQQFPSAFKVTEYIPHLKNAEKVDNTKSIGDKQEKRKKKKKKD